MPVTFTVATNAPQALTPADWASIDSAVGNVARAFARAGKRSAKTQDACTTAYLALTPIRDRGTQDWTNATLVDALHAALKALRDALVVATNPLVVDQLAVAYSKVLVVRDNNLGPSHTL